MTDINQITETATKAAANAAELESAIDAERSAEADVLTAAIEAARPALRAICSRMVSRDTDFHIADVNKARSVVEYHAERGLHLAGAANGERDQPRDNDGGYEGEGLFLLSDGSLARRTWSGAWSKWQGATDDLRSTLAPITVREAMDEWDLDDCLKNLHEALSKAADGKAPERAAKARERADRLRALLTLSK